MNATQDSGGSGRCALDEPDPSADMFSTSEKAVALVEWTPGGHHRTYFAAFASVLERTGARVLPFCPWPDEWNGLVARSEGRFGEIEPPQKLYWPTASWVRPLWLRSRLAALKHFRDLGKRLSEWERLHQTKIDLVFFSCIYDKDFEHFRLARRLLKWPCAGLYLDCRAFRLPGSPHPSTGVVPDPGRIFSLPGWHAVATLDEGSVDKLSRAGGGVPSIWFPDVADVRLPGIGTPEEGLGRKLKAFANGRKLVGCIGHLQKSKGVLELIRAADDPALRDLCFAFVGEVNWYSFSDGEKEEILRAWETHPRMFAHPLRVPDGPRLNSAVAACDVIAAAYLNFPNSSNMLTKAAAFRRPIVVHDGHLMADRVRQFAVGRAVPEGDHGELVRALRDLAADGEVAATGAAAFLHLHSQEELEKAFAAVLAGTSRPMPDPGWIDGGADAENGCERASVAAARS